MAHPAIYATAISIGMLHGIEPGHGWPIAAVFALSHRRRWWFGVWAALILAAAHLVSSFAVVALYYLADRFLRLEGFRWLGPVAGALLLLMAIHQWRSGGDHAGHARHAHAHAHAHHADDHRHDAGAGSAHAAAPADSLLRLAGFAFVLGFVHEEEFAIIALSAGKASAWGVMAVYALSVALSLVLLTSLAIATLNRFEARLRRHERSLPRLSAVILAVMGVAYLGGLI